MRTHADAAHLESVGHSGLVRAQAVRQVERVHLPDALFVQLLAAGRLVEVQVARHRLVRALTRHDHLHAHRLDLYHRVTKTDG
jgi:hypothetical protein